MDCLASEDLKEEKVVTTPIITVPRPNLPCLIQIQIDR
jgi:hypothetical protein